MSGDEGLKNLGGSGAPMAGVGEEGIAVAPVLPWWKRGWKAATAKAGYVLGDQVAFSAGNLAVAALVARHCPQREFGIYVLTQRAMDVLIQLCNVSIWAPLVYKMPGLEGERKTDYIGSVTLHQALACVLGMLLLWVAQAWAHGPARGLFYGVFAPLLWTAAGILFREYTRRMYFAEMRLKEAFWTDVVTNALQAGMVAALAWTGRLTVAGALWSLSLGGWMVSAWWAVREWRTMRVHAEAAWQDFRTNIALGRWFFGSNLVYMVSAQCNPWVLGGMLGGASVAQYAVCESVVNIPRVALNSLQNVLAPMLARRYADGGRAALRREVSRIDRMLLAGTSVCAVGLVLLGPLAARLIYHTAPVQGRWILLFLALNLVAFAGTMSQGYGLSVIDRAGPTFYANAAGLVLQASVCIWLVHRLQVPGAALAMLLGSVVVMMVRGAFYVREMRADA